jgi:hypothetical protein
MEPLVALVAFEHELAVVVRSITNARDFALVLVL